MNAEQQQEQAKLAIQVTPKQVVEGGTVTLHLTGLKKKDKGNDKKINYDVYVLDGSGQTAKTWVLSSDDNGNAEEDFETTGQVAGEYTAQVRPAWPDDGDSAWVRDSFTVASRTQVSANVTLHRAVSYPSRDQALWVAIRNRTGAIGFSRYQKFIDCVLGCGQDSALGKLNPLVKARNEINKKIEAVTPQETCPELWHKDQPLSIHGPSAYAILKFATQVFLTLETGVVIRDDQWNGHKLFDPAEEAWRLNHSDVSAETLKQRLSQYLVGGSNQVLPYLDRIVDALVALNPAGEEEVLPYCHGILQHRFTQPSLLELIWSYWHEEGMLVQTMNAVAMRFQNQRTSRNDPLAELEIDPLRPLNNLIWGYIQDEPNRLSVRRRAFEYQHQYGLTLVGRAIPNQQAADSRSKFIETLHNHLYRTAVFHREDADTTVVADAFPLLNAVKDVHLLLAEGAHNQYGDLPWTARAEMLTIQWMLARPEMREFLRGRHMVPYQEPWMGAVDAMKKLQGWTNTSITHFNQLAVDGERLLLSMRLGDWSDLNNTEEQARNWARYWKPELQRYLYGYLAATGVDLMADITDNREAATRYLPPSVLLQRRLAAQTGQRAVPAPRARARVMARSADYTALPAGGGSVRALGFEEGE